MRNTFFLLVCCLWSLLSSHRGNTQSTVNDLPKFIPPAPEAAALLKADNLSVGYTTGAANINIPLYTLQSGGYSLPISLSYSSTGIKVDEIASTMGTGWSLNYGGVVSRTVMDMPDELRDTSNCNLNSHNFSSPDYDLIQYLGNENADKQSDIFTFSFGGHSGKFILGLNNQPIQLSKNNLKIQIINGLFLEGFIITTDDGTEYRFEAEETSLTRPSSGTGCKDDSWDAEEVKTSWFLTKIILPSRQREINFTYETSATTFSSSVSQTLSLVVSSENYQCSSGQGPTGAACPVNSTTYSSCTSMQTVSSRFISQIETSEGDKVDFFYDLTNRSDLVGGLRLNKIRVSNRGDLVLRNIVFKGSYQNAVNSNSSTESYRLFLDSVKIRNGLDTNTDEQIYSFGYNDYANLSRRLSFAQDMYGYYNGKTNNTSLLPILSSGDVNYSSFNNGTGYGSYTFGDRSIDTVYSKKGLLNKITYPTGGFDTIEYRANRVLNTLNNPDTEDLCGGNSVSRVKSYTGTATLAADKEFTYRYFSDNSLSTFLITDNIVFSFQNNVQKDGYQCQNESGQTIYIGCEGPTCVMATITSNINNPITTYGGQHVYHRIVQEKNRNASQDIGVTEHKYDYLMAGSLAPGNLLGHTVLNAPYHIVPDILIGESETNYYKNTSGQSPAYQLVRKKQNNYENEGFGHYSSYAVKKKYNSVCLGGYGNPPHSSEVGQFDVDEIYVYTNTSRLSSTVERNYDANGQVMIDSTAFAYDNSAIINPTRTLRLGSNGDTLKQKMIYSFDYDTTTVSSNEAIGIRLLKRANIVVPLEIIDILKKAGSEYVTGSKITTYKSDKTAPDKIYNLQITSPLAIGSFTQSSISGGGLSKDSHYDERINFVGYDRFNNIREMKKKNDMSLCYIWDYETGYPIAECLNADTAAIASTSFEADGKGGWAYSGSTTLHPTAPTGLKGYSLSGGNITKSYLSSGTNYIITYWKRDGTVTVNSGSGTSLVTRNGWILYSHEVTGTTSLTISGTAYIDELRLYPKKAMMTTYTYAPLIGMTTQCDPNNRILYYYYDDFNRLIIIRDQDKNIVKQICYNYAGQVENCLQSTTPQWVATGNYRCVLDGNNQNTGDQEREEMNMNQFSATYGQTQWISNGYNATACPPPCNSSACMAQGEAYMCINGQCEQGIKVYTYSLYDAYTGLWECGYHYEYSDQSWSQDYSEYSSCDCTMYNCF